MQCKTAIDLVEKMKISFEAKYMYITLRAFCSDRSTNRYVTINRSCNSVAKYFTGYTIDDIEKYLKELDKNKLITLYRTRETSKRQCIFTVYFEHE